MTTTVGSLVIEMSANVVRLMKDMDDAKRVVDDAMRGITKGVELAMAAIEAIGVGLSIHAFKEWVTGAIEAADAMNNLNKSTGIAVDDLAGLKLAAKQSGTDLEGVAGSINKLSVNIANDVKKFAAIGITATDPLEAFKQLADVFVSIEDPQLRAAVAAQALGKQWQSAAPLLAEGGRGIGDIVTRGKELSGLTKELAEASTKFNNTLAEMEARSQGVANQMIERLLPSLQATAEAMNDSRKSTSLMSSALDGISMLFDTIIVLGANVGYVLKMTGMEIAGLVEQLATIAGGGGLTAAMAIGDRMKADAAQARKEIDEFSAKILKTAPMDEELLRLQGMHTKSTAANTVEIEKNARAFISSNAAKKDGIDTYAKMIKAADDLVASIKFDTSTLTMNNTEKETAIALQKLATLGVKEGTAEYKKYTEAVVAATLDKAQVQSIVDSNKKIEEERLASIKKIEDARLKVEKDYADQMKDISNQIGQSFADALMNGGKSAKEYLVDLFRTLILRPIIQPLISGVVSSSLLGGATSALAGDGSTGSAGGSVGDSLGLMKSASLIKNYYDMAMGGFASLGETVGSYVGVAVAELTGATAAAEAAANAALLGADAVSADIIGALITSSEAATATSAAAAATASALTSAAAGIGAGLFLGNTLSGGLGVGGGSSWLTVGAGTAIGMAVAGPIGAAVGGVLGGLVNAAFGTGAKENTDRGISGTFSSNGSSLSVYQDWQKKGGWFGGGSSGADMSPADAKLTQYINNSVATSALAVKQYANALGLAADGIAGFTYDIKLSLEGLSAEDATKKINELLAAYGNTLASVVTAEIGPFMRDGEEAGATLARLATSLTGVNSVFSTLNLKLMDVSLSGADASSRMADMFGGIDKFIESTNYYYQNFYSQQERAAKTTDQLSGLFGQLGLTLPSTNASFRAMVESARAAGNDGLFAALIKLAPAFNELKTASMSLVDSTFQTLQTVIQTEQTAALAAIEQQKTIAQASVQVASDSVSALTSIFDYLKGQVSEILQSVDAAQTAAQGVAFIRDALQTAQATGYLPDQSALSGAVSAARSGLTSSNFSSSYEMRLSQMQLAAQLQGLQDIAGDQKTTAEYQLLAAQDQLAALEAQAAITTAYYTSQIAYAQSQVNELKGINSGIMSLAQAMDAFATATGAAGGGNLSSQVSQMYQEILGRGADAQGLSSWLGSGMSLSEIRTGILGSQEAKARGYAVGGAYPGGLALVGESGPELINFSNPGMVYTAAQTKGLLSGGDDTAAEIRALREESRAQAQALVQTQLRMTKLMERWDGSGLPETRVTA